MGESDENLLIVGWFQAISPSSTHSINDVADVLGPVEQVPKRGISIQSVPSLSSTIFECVAAPDLHYRIGQLQVRIVPSAIRAEQIFGMLQPDVQPVLGESESTSCSSQLQMLTHWYSELRLGSFDKSPQKPTENEKNVFSIWFITKCAKEILKDRIEKTRKFSISKTRNLTEFFLINNEE